MIAVATAALAATALGAWLLGIRRIPSSRKDLRVSHPDTLYPDSHQAILPIVDMPKAGIVFPGSEILAALDDLDTGATFDFAVNLVTLSREMEFVRNDRAKGNIDDQFIQRRDVRNGDAELITTSRQLAEYNRQLSANIDERPLQAAFLIAVGAPDHHTLDYSVKRLREELTQSGQIAIRHYRGAQTRLWAAFNPGAPNHKTAVDQFAQPTTTKKWSRFVPFTSSMVGNTTGILLGFLRNNALSSAVLIDLPGTARRNRNPCLVCSGALGYGKSYAAKRITRGEIQRGAQAFIVDPGTEWATALADVDNKAVIDMAGNQFSCDPLRTFPPDVAGGYWLDYMVPMMSLDPRSIGVRRLRTILTQDARQRLNIDSTAALMTYIASIQPPAGPDTRPAAVVQLAEDLAPILAALQSWATYDFTQAIFDATLPVPNLKTLDVTIWLTGSLDLPSAEEMSTPHLYERLSDRKRASVAIYGMLVRLARVTFFADNQRFGLIVLEEAAALLNSRAGADDAHLISRRARKHYTGLLIITQNPIRDLALMGDEFITQQLIMPFENEDLARQVAAKVGIRLDDYGDIEEFFLAQPSSEEMRDPTAFDDTDTADSRTAPRRAPRLRIYRRRVPPQIPHLGGHRTRHRTAPRLRHHPRKCSMTTAPTTFGQRAAEYLGYQLATRPRLRRFVTFWLTTHLAAAWSIMAAPPAAASTLAGALNWTGIADSHGVPIGNYYLSVVSTSEAITKAGPGLSADPSSWARWLANALTTGLTHEGIVELLQMQAAVYIFMITTTLWLMRFAMSNSWLYWLATWFRPLFETVRTVLADLWVFPICLLLGLGVGAHHILWHGRKGFGSGIMLSTLVVGMLGTVLTRDPLTDLYNENGLISQGRNLGFTVAQAAFNNGAITSGGGQAQLQHLTGLIADATLRMPLQLMNFGAPVDNIGTCANAYSAALLTPHDPGDLAGPAHAMTTCGAPQALSFAQHLSGANAAVAIFFILLGAVFAAFVCYVTYSYVMVCCAAFVNALLALVAAAPAMIHGHPRRRGLRRIQLFFKHAALVFAYTAYISVAALIVLKMAARGGYADQVGMSHPLARLFMIAITSAVAIGVFWWLKRELGDHTRHRLDPYGHRPGPPRTRRLPTRTRRLRPRPRPQFARPVEQKGRHEPRSGRLRQ